jgi:hypothetical protein
MGGTSETPGKGLMKMNVTLLKEKSVREEIREKWGRWRKNKKYYANTVEWWIKVVKQQIRRLFTHGGLEKRQEDREMENSYYQCIYDILQNPEEAWEDGRREHAKSQNCQAAV